MAEPAGQAADGARSGTPEFDRDARVRRVGDHRYEAGAPDTWRASTGRPQGGLVAAQLMMAMMQSVDDPALSPRAITTHFVRSPGEGSYDIECTIERTGRTITNVTARCTQHDKLQAMAMAVFATPRVGPDFDELPMPRLDPPSPERVREAYAPAFAHPFIDHIVSQPRHGPAPFTAPDAPMRNAGWIGFMDPRPFDPPGLLVLCDAGMMPWWARLEGDSMTATVDYTIHFRAALPLDYPDGLAVVENTTRYVHAGLLDWDAVVWGPDGTVLCLARQQLVTLDQ